MSVRSEFLEAAIRAIKTQHVLKRAVYSYPKIIIRLCIPQKILLKKLSFANF